jgi:hypothetical protein
MPPIVTSAEIGRPAKEMPANMAALKQRMEGS